MSSEDRKADGVRGEFSKGERSRRDESLHEAHIETLYILEEISTLLVLILLDS